MPLLAEILLGDLQLDRLIRVAQRAEERRGRLADLEVDRAVLDLENDVGVEAAVERMEVVVRCSRAVVLQVAPVHQVVVDEAAIEDDAVVRRKGSRDHVGGVGVRPVVCGRPEPALGVGLEDEAAKVGDRAVERVHAILPERRDAGVERIERVESADAARAAEVDRYRHRDAPRPQRIRDPRELGNETVGDGQCVGVDVVDRRAVDAHRREQPSVVAHACEVVQDAAVLEEDRTPGVAALDRAVQVVPVIDPPDRRRRLAALVE